MTRKQYEKLVFSHIVGLSNFEKWWIREYCPFEIWYTIETPAKDAARSIVRFMNIKRGAQDVIVIGEAGL